MLYKPDRLGTFTAKTDCWIFHAYTWMGKTFKFCWNESAVSADAWHEFTIGAFTHHFCWVFLLHCFDSGTIHPAGYYSADHRYGCGCFRSSWCRSVFGKRNVAALPRNLRNTTADRFRKNSIGHVDLQQVLLSCKKEIRCSIKQIPKSLSMRIRWKLYPFFVKIHLYNCPKSCNFNQFFEAN